MTPSGRCVQAVKANGLVLRVPDFPVLGGRQNVDLHLDADLLPHARHHGDGLRLPVGILDAVDLGLEAVGHARLGQQLLRRLDVLLHERQLGVFGMDRADMVMLRRHAVAAIGDLQDLLGIDRQPHRLADARVLPGVVDRLHAGDAGLRRSPTGRAGCDRSSAGPPAARSRPPRCHRPAWRRRRPSRPPDRRRGRCTRRSRGHRRRASSRGSSSRRISCPGRTRSSSPSRCRSSRRRGTCLRTRMHDQRTDSGRSARARRAAAAFAFSRTVWSSTFSTALASHSSVVITALPLSSFLPVSTSFSM